MTELRNIMSCLSRNIKGYQLFLQQWKFQRFYCTGIAPVLQKLSEEDNLKLTYAIKSLKYHEDSSLIFLKIKGSNAEDGASFSNASCRLQTSIEPEVEMKIRRKRFGYASIFHPGIKILENYLQQPNNLPKDASRLQALKRLIDFVPKIPTVSQRLQRNLVSERKRKETDWIIQLIHHYLKELSVNQSYLIDHYSKLMERRCRCCSEKITGEYGDTSMGHETVWHGNVDVMLGIQNVPVNCLDDYEEEIEEEQLCVLNGQSGLEIKADQPDLHRGEQQLVAQAIVFAFLQRKLRSTDYKHFLIPNIGLSKKQAVIYFYDPDHDILMKNLHPFELFGDEDGGLYYVPIIALWLAINYPILGSGVGKSIKSTGYTADFMKTMSQPVKETYRCELRFGGVKGKTKEIEPPKYVYDVEFDDPLVPTLGQI